MLCHGVFEPEVVNILAKGKYFHALRADSLWKKYQNSKEANTYKCEHSNPCKTYEMWRKTHPKLHQDLIIEADQSKLTNLEPKTASLVISKEQVDIQYIIRSLQPPCQEIARADGRHPYTCEHCQSHFKYLKVKAKKQNNAAYKDVPNRCGLKSMTNKYLRDDELSNAMRSAHVELGEMKRNMQLISLTRSRENWETRLLTCSEQDETDTFVNDLIYVLKSGILQSDNVSFTLMSNLLKKLIKKRNHKFSDITIRIGRLLCNQVGRTAYQTWEVSCKSCLYEKLCDRG